MSSFSAITPLLHAASGTPNERPSRRRRVAFFAALAVVVLAVVAAIVVVGAEHRSSGSEAVTSSGTASNSTQVTEFSAGSGSSSSNGADGGSSSEAGGSGGSSSETDSDSSSSNLTGSGSSQSDIGNTGADYTVTFLAVGDWGREGGSNQSEVAELMGKVADAQPVQFVVTTGDNFYNSGLSSVNDPLFAKSFMDVYTAESLQVPWHAVLGNHDYCDNAPPKSTVSPLFQLSIALTNRDPRWHCERSYTEVFAGGKVQFFFIDTSPFIQRYQKEKWARCMGGLLQQSWQAQLFELERRLSKSTADWKLVVGHHPTYSGGEHGNNTEIVKHLEPLFKKYGVQAYFAGHDHILQDIELDGYEMIITGGGSETQRPPSIITSNSKYYYGYSGFVGVSVEPEVMTVDFFTLEGQLAPNYTTTIQRTPAGGRSL